jgi:RNA polymerase sigma factor (sigma-70 family)
LFEFCAPFSVRRAYALGCRGLPFRWLGNGGLAPATFRMSEGIPVRRGSGPSVDPTRPLDGCASLVEWLHAQSKASRWGVSREHFACVLERSTKKLLTTGTVTPQKLEAYLGALHLEDLALATACAEGCELAWEHFITTYRSYLRAAAAAMLRSKSGSAEASELADSLFSELYGLDKQKDTGRSLFRYFHGRSSLKTWLRAVLAQRHIDSLRAGRRFEELVEDHAYDGSKRTLCGPPVQLSDPHRQRYTELFARAFEASLEGLEPQGKERLRLYYAEEKTLAEIGRLLGEHESSVSRHLDRVRRDLRNAVEEFLRLGFVARNGSPAQLGLSEAEIALCFEYSAENAAIDLDKLLPPQSPGRAPGKRPT